MYLPNRELIFVPEAKIVHYLLNKDHIDGGPKAEYYLKRGFSLSEWELLATALIEHGRTHEVTKATRVPYAILYRIEGTLVTPDGRNPFVRSVWKIPDGEKVPRLVTAYKIGGRNKYARI